MANQIVQLGRRVLNANANRVSTSINFFRSPHCNSSQNRFHYRHISRHFYTRVPPTIRRKKRGNGNQRSLVIPLGKKWLVNLGK